MKTPWPPFPVSPLRALWVPVSLATCLRLAACAALPESPLLGIPPPAPGTVVWTGEVRVDQDVTLPRGSRLELQPGTVVRFAFQDEAGGLGAIAGDPGDRPAGGLCSLSSRNNLRYDKYLKRVG